MSSILITHSFEAWTMSHLTSTNNRRTEHWCDCVLCIDYFLCMSVGSYYKNWVLGSSLSRDNCCTKCLKFTSTISENSETIQIPFLVAGVQDSRVHLLYLCISFTCNVAWSVRLNDYSKGWLKGTALVLKVQLCVIYIYFFQRPYERYYMYCSDQEWYSLVLFSEIVLLSRILLRGVLRTFTTYFYS